MSLIVAIPLLIGVLVLGTILWPRVVHDGVGRRTRVRREPSGLQGQVAEWLYWDAAVRRPDVRRYADPETPAEPPKEPADRALHAVVLREALEHRLPMDVAYQRVKQRATSPAARAFLNGRVGRAIRLDWQRRYRGPDALFLPWFYAVATVRYGRRHLFLETLSHLLKELTPA